MAVGLDRDRAVEGCRTNLNFLAALAMPEVFKYLFPPTFLAIWQLLCQSLQGEKGQHHLAIGIPRGFGKTVLLKLWCLYLILFSKRRFILVVCNTEGLAENFIADVADLLDQPNIKAIFGDWRMSIEKDTLGLKKFTFRGRDIILAGLGQGSSLRGLNIKFVRPDVIIMDDMQSREQAQSPAEAARVLSWMMGTLLKANNKENCTFAFIGNMYPFEGAILKKLRKNPAWTTFICGALLSDGESLWPEYRSVDDILTEYQNDLAMGVPEIFFSEVMNDDEAGARSGIDITQFNVDHTPREEEQYEGGYVLIDPSLGKKKSDDVAIGVVLIKNGKDVLREVVVGKFDPGQQESIPIKLAMKWNLLAIVVESVAYQGVLVYHINRRKTQLGLHNLQVLEILPGKEHKNARIKDGLMRLISKDPSAMSMVHADCKAAVQHQTIYFDPLKDNNKDDILDLVAYMPKVRKRYPFQLSTFVQQVHEEQGSSFSDTLELGF